MNKYLKIIFKSNGEVLKVVKEVWLDEGVSVGDTLDSAMLIGDDQEDLGFELRSNVVVEEILSVVDASLTIERQY